MTALNIKNLSYAYLFDHKLKLNKTRRIELHILNILFFLVGITLILGIAFIILNDILGVINWR